MRISDWSSDVCSSDLCGSRVGGPKGRGGGGLRALWGAPSAAPSNLNPLRARGIFAARKDNHMAAKKQKDSSADLRTNEKKWTKPRMDAGWTDRKSTRLNSSHYCASRMPSSALKKNKKTK